MLTDEDKAVLAHVTADPDAWINHVLTYCPQKYGAEAGERIALDWLYAKCRRDIHVANYRAEKDKPDYESWRNKPDVPALFAPNAPPRPKHAPRGKLPSRSVLDRLAAVEQRIAAAEAAKQQQQERLQNLFN